MSEYNPKNYTMNDWPDEILNQPFKDDVIPRTEPPKCKECGDVLGKCDHF